jgi:probable phosphoglycerate mutase
MPGTDVPPPSSRLLVLRHAQSTWNAAGRWQGWADPPLSELGEQQIAAASGVLRRQGATGFDAAYCSDLQRAQRSAQLLCQALDGPQPTVRRDLREHDVGQWSGLTRSEIEAGWPGQIRQWSRGELPATPGGEERLQFEARIHGAILDIARANLGRRVLVVCHGGAIRALTRVIGTEQAQVGSLSGCWLALENDHLGVVDEVDPLSQAPDLPISSLRSSPEAPTE